MRLADLIKGKALLRLVNKPEMDAAIAAGGGGGGGAGAFKAYLSAAQTIPSAAVTKLNFDAVVFDTASGFDTAMGQFRPSVAGYYQINGNLHINGGSFPVIQPILLKNGVSIAVGAYNTAGGGTDNISNVNDVVYLNGSSDYVELHAYTSNGGSASAAAAATFMSGSFLGQ